MWTDAELEARMRRGWRGGMAEGTPCGNGSLLVNTQSVRSALPGVLADYNIRSVCDAGAGDMHWAQDALRGISYMPFYMPFDLVPRTPAVQQIDITKQALPKCDAIICRLVLIHLDPPRILGALGLFKQSAQYLFASQYDNADNTFDRTNQFNRTNLVKAPYNLGDPKLRIPDINESGASLAMWRL